MTRLRGNAILDLRFADTASAVLNRAIETLEDAHRHAPDDTGILNDLAVAYLALGQRVQGLTPMLRALDAVEHAAALDSLDRTILFNRALILQRLYLFAGAQRAWVRYLAVERDPRWRTEAEAHAGWIARSTDQTSWDSLLHSPPVRMDADARTRIATRVRRSPQAAREFGFPLLGAWGVAIQQGDGVRAARLLTVAREIGRVSDESRLDRSVSLMVRAIDAAAGDSRRVRELADGHAALARGFSLYNGAAETASIPHLNQAERTLRLAGSPAARWAAFYHGAAAVNSVDYDAADRHLNELRREAGPDEPALVGKTIWALGVSQLRRGDHARASQLYRQAAPYILATREAENAGAVAVLLAESQMLAGQLVEGRAEALRALRMVSPFRRSGYLNNHLAIVASEARTEGLPHAALAVADELVTVSRSIPRPTTRALALLTRARARMGLERLNAAEADLEEATRWAKRIPPGRSGDRVRARVQLIVGQVTRARDPRRALPTLAAAAETYLAFGNDLYLPAALHEAALAARASGDPRTRDWLQKAMSHLERQEASFTKVEDRAAFYETAENVFDAMIELELDEGRSDAAFQALERGRVHGWARGRRASFAEGPSTPATLAQVAASVPHDMLLVEYALLRDRVVIWTVSRQGAEQHVVSIPRNSVVSLLDAFMDTGSVDAGTRLFHLLLGPLGSRMAQTRQLTIVPDRELYRVPFAGLRDGASGRYVVETHQVRTVPSAGFFLASASAPPVVKPAATALIVGDPAIDPAAAGPLPPLPGAAREADAITRLYPGATRLGGADASRGAVLALLPRHSIFHFAGHAVFNPDQPEQSYLALGSDGVNGGILRAWEIGGLRLSNLSVVVLSACSSLSPRASRTGAVAGLAYSFLRAGAPATVSTLRDVDDGVTTELLVAFHRHLAAGSPAAEALRLAQVEALRSPRANARDPRTWAAFIYTGP